jgi:hypothetical protein
MKPKDIFLPTTKWGQVTIFCALTLFHAGLTVVGFLSYTKTALTASHGGPLSEWTTFGQYAKSLFLWPLLLPLLRDRPLLLGGLHGFVLVLFNSAIWIAVGWLICSFFYKKRI